MSELQELLKRAFVDDDTEAFKQLHNNLEHADYKLGQALRVAREYKAKLERCTALARDGKVCPGQTL